jgi:hypothetical protein
MFVVGLLEKLESDKEALASHEAITNEVVGCMVRVTKMHTLRILRSKSSVKLTTRIELERQVQRLPRRFMQLRYSLRFL